MLVAVALSTVRLVIAPVVLFKVVIVPDATVRSSIVPLVIVVVARVVTPVA